MMNLNTRQQAMLKEIGVRLPWPSPVSARPATAHTQQKSVAQGVAPHGDSHAQTSAAQHIQAIRAQASQLKESPKKHPPAAQAVQKATAQSTRSEDKASAMLPAKTAPSQAAPKQEQAPISITLTPSEIEARAHEISQMGWEALQLAVNQCDACSLCKTRTQTVFSAGVPTAQCMIVGEAPGEQEDKKGEPFVGAAGMLLDRMLQQLKLSRAPVEGQNPVYISNVLKCRPPRNRNPEPTEMALCQAFLKRQIELVQPKVILIVGRFAVQTLLETTDAIGRLRGTVHQYKNTPAVVTYHPAYLLRNPIDKRKSWEDLCLAAEIYSAV